MRKQISLLLLSLSLGFGVANAQEKMRMKADDKIKIAMEKLTVLKLGDDVTAKTQAVLTEYYNAQQQLMDQKRATPETDAVKAKRKEIQNTRDVKLKELFTPDQYKKWYREIEPSLFSQKNGKAQ